MSDLAAHKDVCASGWQEQSAHQMQMLPPFDSFWNELLEFFAWLEHPERIAGAALSSIPVAASAGSVVTLSGGMAQFNRLDRIRFAAVNRLCVELNYMKENGERNTYLIEPYSLRVTADNNMVLYGVKLPTAEIRSFRTDRIINATVTERTFTPRYSIDFLPDGPAELSARLSTPQSLHLPQGGTRAPSSKAPRAAKSHGGPRYVFRCTVCGKQFTRSTYSVPVFFPTASPRKFFCNCNGQAA